MDALDVVGADKRATKSELSDILNTDKVRVRMRI